MVQIDITSLLPGYRHSAQPLLGFLEMDDEGLPVSLFRVSGNLIICLGRGCIHMEKSVESDSGSVSR